MYEGAIQDLIDALGRLPGIGPKSAQRIAFHILQSDSEVASALVDSIRVVKERVKFCVQCGNVSEEDECRICRDPRRDNTIICVVEESKDVIAIERVFSQHNVRTGMGTGQAAGVALLLAAKAGIPVMMHTPSEVKAAVSGSGRANKAQVAQMVQKIVNLDSIPKPVDATDALALAICNIWRGGATARINQAVEVEKSRLRKLRG